VTLVAVLMTLAVGLATPASASISQYIRTPRNAFRVAVDNGVHAWSVDSTAHPYAYRVWVKPSGGPAYPVSAATSSALVGNIDLGNPTYGNVLTFWAGRGYGRGQRDLRLWDLDNREPLTLPAGINTPKADEVEPSISGDYLLFGRIQPSGASRLLLYRFSTHTFTSIVHLKPSGFPYFSGQIDGDYVVYHVCSGTTGVCNVFRRQVSSSTTVKVPNPRRATYWPTVLADGTVYYVQGSPRVCGHRTRLMRWTGGGTATILATLPEGADAAGMDADRQGGNTTLYFTRIRCVDSHYGIYQMPGA
jgi:hypothetical protein